MTFYRMPRLAALAGALAIGLTMVAVDHADARRGGSFGSRGTRTFQQVPATRTAPQPTAPVERSTTPNPGPAATTNSAARQTQTTAQRPGLFNGFGGAMLRGVLIGGLIGMLLGYGFGGMAGMLGFLLQALLIGVLIALALRFFRGGRQPALAAAGGNSVPFGRVEPPRGSRDMTQFRMPNLGAAPAAPAPQEITLDQDDLDTFERRLTEVQEAFAAEDHATLRRLVTPEMVSYLSEELADNARNGVRNEVSGVHLLQADIAESWREDGRDYASAAFTYESRDVMRDRASGRIVSGDEKPTETTEVWTFVRQSGAGWKLSAIQEV